MRLHPCCGAAVIHPSGEVPFVARCEPEATSCCCAADAIAMSAYLETHRIQERRVGYVVVRLHDGAELTAEKAGVGKKFGLPSMSERYEKGLKAAARVTRRVA